MDVVYEDDEIMNKKVPQKSLTERNLKANFNQNDFQRGLQNIPKLAIQNLGKTEHRKTKNNAFFMHKDKDFVSFYKDQPESILSKIDYHKTIDNQLDNEFKTYETEQGFESYNENRNTNNFDSQRSDIYFKKDKGLETISSIPKIGDDRLENSAYKSTLESKAEKINSEIKRISEQSETNSDLFVNHKERMFKSYNIQFKGLKPILEGSNQTEKPIVKTGKKNFIEMNKLIHNPKGPKKAQVNLRE